MRLQTSEPTGREGGLHVFRLEGDYWTVVFEGRTVRLHDAKGLRYLALLLRRPGERIHVNELQAAGRGRPSLVRTRDAESALPIERARLAVTKGIGTALERITEVHPVLGAYLRVTVRRGYFCAYTPDPRHPISWEG